MAVPFLPPFLPLAEPLRSNPLAPPPPEQRANLPGAGRACRHLLGLDSRAARQSLVAAGAVADKAGRAGPGRVAYATAVEGSAPEALAEE